MAAEHTATDTAHTDGHAPVHAGDTHAEITVQPGHDAHGGDHAFNPVKVDVPMVIWTWVTFALLAWVLHKFAWKPILAGLENREANIRKAIDDAAETAEKLKEIKDAQDSLIAEADEKAKDIVSKARAAANEAARVIERKAKEDAQIMLETAQREIKISQEKAQAALRHESAELAVALAGKILQEKLDASKHKQLTDRMIEEL